MPRSLPKEGVWHPLNSENSEFSHSLGQEQTFGKGNFKRKYLLDL
jgi:hypothetical protein